jgi:toxin ParE1/3/4
MTPTRWTRPALSDLADIDDRNRPLSSDHADRVAREAVAAGRFLAEYPMAGPVISDGVRKWRVRGTDFILLYHVEAGAVTILRVRHAREDWHP